MRFPLAPLYLGNLYKWERHPLKLNRQEIELFLWVNSTMPLDMIESCSVGINKDSHSVEVYSMCKVARQFGHDQMAHRKPLSPLDVDFSYCISEFHYTRMHESYKEIKSCVMLTFDRVTYYSYGWLAY
ncbi:hypothetical protein Goarm_005779 [Gossypium armourianum]|uniref:Uncharacterized protein n=1 Tax=Gossypium armourianum TaxID=34283 RepID=A0A7J9KFW6_9ROSI|nr:hypothetical protein [Gossypium armourianum]